MKRTPDYFQPGFGPKQPELQQHMPSCATGPRQVMPWHSHLFLLLWEQVTEHIGPDAVPDTVHDLEAIFKDQASFMILEAAQARSAET